MGSSKKRVVTMRMIIGGALAIAGMFGLCSCVFLQQNQLFVVLISTPCVFIGCAIMESGWIRF